MRVRVRVRVRVRNRIRVRDLGLAHRDVGREVPVLDLRRSKVIVWAVCSLLGVW